MILMHLKPHVSPFCGVWQYGSMALAPLAQGHRYSTSLSHCSQFIAFLGHNFARGCIELLDALLDKDQLYINKNNQV